MAFKNRKLAKEINARPCEWCGWQAARRDAAHIIDAADGGDESKDNAISLCPNCHRVFDEKFRPKLYRALAAWLKTHATLPPSWEKDNKMPRASSAKKKDR